MQTTKFKEYNLTILSNISNVEHMEKAKAYFEEKTGLKTRYTLAKKTNHRVGIRKSQKLGFTCKLYGSRIGKFIHTIDEIVLSPKSVNKYGSINIGLAEYYRISSLVHNPDINNFGFSLHWNVSYEGYYVKGERQIIEISVEELMKYLSTNYKNIVIKHAKS